jgi:hypothetical protein
MKHLLALSLLFGAVSLSAQYGPPARDLEEAQFFLRELQRQIEPAITEARDQAIVFGLVSRVHNKLIGKEPATEISDGIKLIDDFLDRRHRAANELSRENVKTLASVRKELELAQPPYAILALRDRLHHEFVHNLERQALKNLQRVEQMESEWSVLQQRQFKPLRDAVMSGVTITASEVKTD